MGWNIDYAKSVSKADWIEQHKHHADEFDLAAEYDKMVEPERKEVEPPKDEKEGLS
jgi:hypothetical protein